MRVRLFASLLVVCFLATVLGCSSSDDPTTPPPPPKTPMPVSDLRVTAGADGQVTLAWTSPQLEAKADYSVKYDLRHMPYGSEGAAWDQWVPLDPPMNDTVPGIYHAFVVRGLTPGSVNVFMMRASSDGEEWSDGSNMAVGTASPAYDTTAPDPVLDLTQIGGSSTTLKVEWSLVGNDGPYGQAPHYQVRYSESPITNQTWDQATISADISISGADKVSHTISGLTGETVYYVAVKASDEAGNVSSVSNVPVLTTVNFRILEVFVDGSGDYATIEAALRYSEPGDLILVGPGRYTWTNQGTGDPLTGMINTPARIDSVELRSTHGPVETILDAEQQGAIMSITGGTIIPPVGERYWTGITVDGFTFTNGYRIIEGQDSTNGGAGINAHLTDSVIRNCVFTENEATGGGAIWVGGQGALVVENCTIMNNRARWGAGISLANSEPRITVRNCVIRDNTATIAGGGILAWHCKFTLENNLIFGNRAGEYGGAVAVYELELPLHTGSEIAGNTMVDNHAIHGSGIYFETVPELLLTRNIIAYNTGGPGIRGVKVTGLEIGCNNVFGNEESGIWPNATVDLGGNIELDPLFCNLSSFMLQSDSPCLPPTAACGLMGARGQGCTP